MVKSRRHTKRAINEDRKHLVVGTMTFKWLNSKSIVPPAKLTSGTIALHWGVWVFFFGNFLQDKSKHNTGQAGLSGRGGDFQLQSRRRPLLQNIGQLLVNQTPLFSSNDFTFRGWSIMASISNFYEDPTPLGDTHLFWSFFFPIWHWICDNLLPKSHHHLTSPFLKWLMQYRPLS